MYCLRQLCCVLLQLLVQRAHLAQLRCLFDLFLTRLRQYSRLLLQSLPCRCHIFNQLWQASVFLLIPGCRLFQNTAGRLQPDQFRLQLCRPHCQGQPGTLRLELLLLLCQLQPFLLKLFLLQLQLTDLLLPAHTGIQCCNLPSQRLFISLRLPKRL